MATGSEASAVQHVVAEIARSRRYRSVDPSAIARLAGGALRAAQGDLGDAVKRTKRQLHQVFGAYVGEANRYRGLLAEIERSAAAGGDDDATRATLRRALQLHASTRERLSILDRFYRDIFRCSGPPRQLLDLGCGLNPLACPWMSLPDGAVYHAIDVDREQMALVKGMLQILGVTAVIEVRDVLASPPGPPCQVALLLKVLPCFEQQEAGSGWRLMETVPAEVIVASFPTRSLGGREKGMRTHYAAEFEQQLHARSWRHERLDFPCELVYVVWR